MAWIRKRQQIVPSYGLWESPPNMASIVGVWQPSLLRPYLGVCFQGTVWIWDISCSFYMGLLSQGGMLMVSGRCQVVVGIQLSWVQTGTSCKSEGSWMWVLKPDFLQLPPLSEPGFIHMSLTISFGSRDCEGAPILTGSSSFFDFIFQSPHIEFILLVQFASRSPSRVECKTNGWGSTSQNVRCHFVFWIHSTFLSSEGCFGAVAWEITYVSGGNECSIPPKPLGCS